MIPYIGDMGSREGRYTPYEGTVLANQIRRKLGVYLTGNWREATPYLLLFCLILLLLYVIRLKFRLFHLIKFNRCQNHTHHLEILN